MRKPTRTTVGVVGAIVVIVGVMAASALTRPPTSEQGTAPQESVAAEAPAVSAEPQEPQGIGIDLARREPGDPLALGSETAPVVLIEYSDFRCPFCGVFARDTKPALMKYVDAGTLRIEFRDLPIFGQQSMDAAAAGRAAGKQGKFWEFHDAVFADAPRRGHADLSMAVLTKHAKKAGVPDMEAFRADLKSGEMVKAVQVDLEEAQQLGASSTPVFLVNDEPIVGAQPTDVFVEKIERLAAS